MAYNDPAGPGYAAGTADTRLAAVDLGRSAIGAIVPVIQQVTHELTGHGTLAPVQVPTPGTRVRLSSSSLPVRRALIVALDTNTQNPVVIGDANVVAALGTQATPTRRGVPLVPGSAVVIEFNDLTNVWIDVVSGAAADGVTAWYWT